MKQIIEIPIKGMHCRSCEIVLTEKLEALAAVQKAEVSLRTKTATIHAVHPPNEAVLGEVVRAAGYDIGTDRLPWISKNISDYRDVIIGVVIVALLAVFISNIGDGITTGNLVTGGVVVALLFGLTAGFSTCMALVGGLVLGLSAKYAQKYPQATAIQKFWPHLYFNASRIVGFFVLGGIIGWLGSAFQLQGAALGILMIIVGVVMAIVGLQLTQLFPRLSSGGLTLPSGLAKRLGLQKSKAQGYSPKSAITLGVISFFLPCGFTQAMQLYAVSTGSFVTGAVVMSLFAIGTTPGLLGIGGLVSAANGPTAKHFFKVAGVAVVAMAMINVFNGYNLTGWPKPFEFVKTQMAAEKPPKFTPTSLMGEVETPKPVSQDEAADNRLRAKYTLASGMVPDRFTIRAGQSYTLEVKALEDGVGCMSTVVIPGLNNDVQYLLKNKTNVLPFKVTRPGTYQITCAMGVPHGTIKVV